MPKTTFDKSHFYQACKNNHISFVVCAKVLMMHGIFISIYEIFVEHVKFSILTENFCLYDYIQNLK